MSQRQVYLAVGALLTAIAWDYTQWVNSLDWNPNAKFNWRLAIARYVMIVSGVLTGADAIESVKGSPVFML